jgi:transcriptional regulator with XRE-family HTH domain
MGSRFDTRRFAASVRTKRGERSLREAATDIGTISPSTLLRLEREEVPDMETFLRICDWLRMAPSELFIQKKPRG